MSRIRKRFVPLKSSPVLTSINSQWVLRDGVWVRTLGPTEHYYTAASTRRYSLCKRCTDELHPGPPYIQGGPLDIIECRDPGTEAMGSVGYRATVTSSNGLVRYSTAGNMWSKFIPPSDERMAVPLSDARFDKLLLLTGDELSEQGPKAYEKFSPLKPSVDMGQFFAEFREIPRMLQTSAKNFARLWKSRGGKRLHFGPKNIADEWLNNQFGWVPFVSTLVDFVKTTINLSNRLDRLRQYNGKWEKRGGIVSSTEERELYSTYNYCVVGSTSSVFDPRVTSQTWRSTTSKTWFEAEFKYWLPKLQSNKWDPDTISQLYGMRMTPSLLYELMPWSWMIDWVADIGSILAAADSQSYGQLVSRNAYLMRTTKRWYEHYGRISLKGGSSVTGKWVYPTVTRKERVKATPFGFGVHFNELSPWKLSILSALGFSKNRMRWSASGFL